MIEPNHLCYKRYPLPRAIVSATFNFSTCVDPKIWERASLREKCPNTEVFLVRIFPNSDQKKLRIWTLFMQCV